MAPSWGLLQTEFLIYRAQELSVAMTNRYELVQSVNDRCVGKGVPNFAEGVKTLKEGMMEVNDVRLVGFQEVA